jgi:hypothetical protein
MSMTDIRSNFYKKAKFHFMWQEVKLCASQRDTIQECKIIASLLCGSLNMCKCVQKC